MSLSRRATASRWSDRAWMLTDQADDGRRSPPSCASRRPARAAARERARVVAAPVHDHVGVAGVGVDRDAPARTGFAVAHEAGRGERAVEQARGGERVGDRARAVVAAGVAAVPAAVDVRRGGDLVRGRDDPADDVAARRRARARAAGGAWAPRSWPCGRPARAARRPAGGAGWRRSGPARTRAAPRCRCAAQLGGLAVEQRGAQRVGLVAVVLGVACELGVGAAQLLELHRHALHLHRARRACRRAPTRCGARSGAGTRSARRGRRSRRR